MGGSIKKVLKESTILGPTGVMDEPKKPAPLPLPEAPVGAGTAGEGSVDKKKLKSGRGGTIIAGPLRPNTGKKRLLGGNI